jgi:predicted acylesterase/phospholipase RssA
MFMLFLLDRVPAILSTGLTARAAGAQCLHVFARLRIRAGGIIMERRRILSIDGGGIRGIIPLCFLIELEEQLKVRSRDFFSLMAGTSTGAIISGALSMGLTAEETLQIYIDLNSRVFQFNPLEWICRLGAFRYRTQPMVDLIQERIGDPALNDVPNDIVLTATRVSDGRPFYFVKDNAVNGQKFGTLKLADCIAASSAAPTFFEPWDVPGIGVCVDGGVGIAGNPAYVACVESQERMPAGKYPPDQTTIVSLGTGFYNKVNAPGHLVDWALWVLGELLEDPAEQQTQLIDRHYRPAGMHTLRYNVDMGEEIGMDNIAAVPRLVEIGRQAASKIDWNEEITALDGTKSLDAGVTVRKVFTAGDDEPKK